jgi:hypothetical protein
VRFGGDRSSRAEGNLAWMCFDDHSIYDSKTKQDKNDTISEVKAARDKLYALVAEGKHLTVVLFIAQEMAELIHQNDILG